MVGARAREPIFSETHTNEFRGTRESAPEPAGTRARLRPGRWVCEKGGQARDEEGRAEGGLVDLLFLPALLVALGVWFWVRGPASPFLAKRIQTSFAGPGNPPQSPPARAPHCALVGGYVRRGGRQEPEEPLRGGCRAALGTPPRQPSPAAVQQSHVIHRRSRVVPYGLPGYRRLRRAPPQHRRCSPGASRPGPGARHLGRLLSGAREYPVCAEGWAMWVLGGSPDLFKATGGTCRLGTP